MESCVSRIYILVWNCPLTCPRFCLELFGALFAPLSGIVRGRFDQFWPEKFRTSFHLVRVLCLKAETAPRTIPDEIFCLELFAALFAICSRPLCAFGDPPESSLLGFLCLAFWFNTNGIL